MADASEGDTYDDSDEVEVQIRIEPRIEALERLNISPDEFEEQLGKAIEDYQAKIESLPPDGDAPPLEDIPVRVGGQTHKLGDLCEVEILSGEDFLDEEGLDDDFDDEDSFLDDESE